MFQVFSQIETLFTPQSRVKKCIQSVLGEMRRREPTLALAEIWLFASLHLGLVKKHNFVEGDSWPKVERKGGLITIGIFDYVPYILSICVFTLVFTLSQRGSRLKSKSLKAKSTVVPFSSKDPTTRCWCRMVFATAPF